MMNFKSLVVIALLIAGKIGFAQDNFKWKTATANGYTYKYVTNDPSKTRFYTLKNGLTVMLSPNPDKPSIEWRMTIRAGSNTDPRTNTGLAHYLEHLLFKGTDKFGTANWAKEKPLLDKIDALYEKYNKTTDLARRKEIYKEIDKISNEASNYSIANEYDKMITALGGTSTNAHTWYEETVYKEDLPSNAIDKFLAIEAERFRNPIFRIFHTELEAVYEEKNRSLDDDGDKLDETMMAKLFPTHNYGQQTTIGEIEHLKNPSLVEIKKYYAKYYVPNNMACIFAGDFNPDEMIKKIDKAFAYMTAKPLSLYNPKPEAPLASIQKVDVVGPSAERVELMYRGYAQNTKESLMLSLIQSILNNGKAGLIDINLNKKQQVLRASADYQQMKDYGVFSLSAIPRQGQSLEEASKQLLSQIDSLKKGNFDETLLKAILANEKLDFLQAFDSNQNRVEHLSNEFVMNRGSQWEQSLAQIDAKSKITKPQLLAFANQFFKNNYVIGFKRKGEDKSIQKVEKPAITPINPNANLASAFVKKITAMPTKAIAPKFLDYQKDMAKAKAGIADVLAIKNNENDIFRMTYRFNHGANNYKLLQYAANYLPFLGTDKYTAEELSKAFYNIACSYNLNVGTETTTISISGLQENFEKATNLVEHIFSHVKADEQALENLKSSILKNRENAKLNKSSIMRGLTSYAQFGAINPFNNVLSNDEVKAIKAEDLIYHLHNLLNYEHVITYYGPKTPVDAASLIAKNHSLPKEFTPAAPAKVYSYVQQDTNKVYFANYDMVQSEIRWIRNTGTFSKNDMAKIQMYNNYFGGGMGSIVFQTIRESKALAYSTFAFYATADKTGKQNSMIAYVGSQSDKMNDAITGMNELLNDLPERDKSFNDAKANLISGLEIARTTKDAVFDSYFADKRLGYDHDSKLDLYREVKPITFATVKNFTKEKVANKAYTYCIVASDKRVKPDDLKKYGEVTTLTLEQIFGY